MSLFSKMGRAFNTIEGIANKPAVRDMIAGTKSVFKPMGGLSFYKGPALLGAAGAGIGAAQGAMDPRHDYMGYMARDAAIGFGAGVTGKLGRSMWKNVRPAVGNFVKDARFEGMLERAETIQRKAAATAGPSGIKDLWQ